MENRPCKRKLAAGKLFCIAGLLLLSHSCAGGGASTKGLTPLGGQPAATGFGLPNPLQLAHVPSYYGDEEHTRQGNDYLPGYAQNVHAVNEDDLALDPLYDPRWPYASPYLSWVIYSFDIGERDQVRCCNINFVYEQRPEPGQCWYGFADWERNNWEWIQSDIASFTSADWSNRISADGRLLLAVVYYASTTAVIRQVAVELAANPIWQIETVVDNDTDGYHPFHVSLALDSTGAPRIAFYDFVASDLVYAAKDGGEWQLTVIDSEGDTGCHPQLVLDRDEQPVIAYYTPEQGGAVMLASFDGDQWSLETVAPAREQWNHPALVLDGDDVPHIAFYSATGNAVHASRPASEWLTEQIDAAAADATRAPIDLAVDAGGRPVIVYGAKVAEEQRNYLAQFNGATWDSEEIPLDMAEPFLELQLLLTTSDEPVIYYMLPMMDWNINPYKIAQRSLEGWTVLGAGAHGDGTCSIALDSSDRLHFCHQGYPSVEYDMLSGGSKFNEEISDLIYSAQEVSLALDAEQRPHLAVAESTYNPESYASLIYGYRIEPVSE